MTIRSIPLQNRRWWALGALALSVLVVGLDLFVLTLALPTLSADLHASTSDLQWFVDAYSLVLAAALLPAGLLGDRYGRKKLLITALVLFAVASLACAYSSSSGELIAARALLGLAAAVILPLSLAVIPVLFSAEERPKAIAAVGGATFLGFPIGPVLGGWLLDHFWWGSVFLINVPLTAIGIVAIMALVPESKSPSPGRIDYPGVLLSIVGLVLVVYGIIQGGDTGSWLRGDVLGPIAGGLAVLGFFVWLEARTEHPSLDVRLFRDPRLSSAATAIALVFFAMAGVYFFISFYLQNVRGYTPLHAGLLTIPLAAGQLISSTRSAGTVRRFGARAVCSTGLLMVAAALVGYHFLGTTTPIWVLEVAFFAQGFGMGNVMPPATEAVMSVVPRQRGGAGSAITNTSRQVAVALGVAVLGSILAQAYRSRLAPHLSAVPSAARSAATESISATQAVAQQIGGPAGGRLLAAANSSFVHAMHVTSLISVVIAVLGAGAMAIWMPGRQAAAARAAGASVATGASVAGVAQRGSAAAGAAGGYPVANPTPAGGAAGLEG